MQKNKLRDLVVFFNILPLLRKNNFSDGVLVISVFSHQGL